MKTSERSLHQVDRQRAEAALARHVKDLFRSLPTLQGFWLRPDPKVADLSVVSWTGCAAGQDLQELVKKSLIQLAETNPEAVQLIRGRTFARIVH